MERLCCLTSFQRFSSEDEEHSHEIGPIPTSLAAGQAFGQGTLHGQIGRLIAVCVLIQRIPTRTACQVISEVW